MFKRINIRTNIALLLTAMIALPIMQTTIIAQPNSNDIHKNTHTNMMYDIMGPPLGSYDINQNPRKFDYIANNDEKPEIQINGESSGKNNGIKINFANTNNTKNEINPKYLSQYNELVKATQRHEKKLYIPIIGNQKRILQLFYKSNLERIKIGRKCSAKYYF